MTIIYDEVPKVVYDDKPDNRRDATAKVKTKPAMPEASAWVSEVPQALVQNPLAKIASGYTAMLGSVFPGKTGQGAEWQKATETALSFDPKSPTSKALLKAVGLPYEYLVEKPSHWVGKKIAEKGAPAAGAIVEGAAQAAPFALGLRSPKSSTTPVATLAKERGFALTPTEGGGGLVSKIAEGLSGEEKLSKKIARKNAALAATELGKDIGIPEGTPFTRESIAAARKAAHAPYEEARALGTIHTSVEYGKALDSIEAQYKNAAKSFPEGQSTLAKDVLATVNGHRVDRFDASAGIDEIKALREAANTAYRANDPALGKTYKSVANAIEDEYIQHVVKLGKDQPALVVKDTGLLDRLKAARTIIAKTYEADKAFEKDGTINPQKLAQIERKSPGKLTGAAKDIAVLAEDAPRSFRRDTGGNVSFPTWADAIMAGLTGGVEGAAHGIYSGGAAMPLALVARPATRALLSSDPYQAYQASWLPSAIQNATPFASMLSSIAAEEASKARNAKRQSP